MDETSGQFYAVYGNTYQHISTKPILEQTWRTGELIDQLAAMRQAFGYTGLQDQCHHLTSHSQQQVSHATVQYQPPSFNLDRPTMHLTVEERIQVHHNYISTISNHEHN